MQYEKNVIIFWHLLSEDFLPTLSLNIYDNKCAMLVKEIFEM